MADLAITDTAVIPSGAEQKLKAGEAITAGMPIYKKTADSKAYKADANVTVAEADVIGVATNNAAPGQTVNYLQTGNDLTMNAVLTPGAIYILSATAGKICPTADLVTGMFVTAIGVAKTSTVLTLAINASGVQVP